jgi:hypothetical protein
MTSAQSAQTKHETAFRERVLQALRILTEGAEPVRVEAIHSQYMRVVKDSPPAGRDASLEPRSVEAIGRALARLREAGLAERECRTGHVFFWRST